MTIRIFSPSFFIAATAYICLACAAQADGMEGGASSRKSSGVERDYDRLPVDGRIKLLAYDPSDIYTLPTRVGYQTNIEFSDREEVETISVGDRSFWQIIPSGSRLFIRPLQENVATNMTVITNRHSYQFDLRSVDGKERSIVYVARFTYPEDEAKKSRAIPYEDPFFSEPAARQAPVAPVLAPAPAPAAKPVVLNRQDAPSPAMPRPMLAPPPEAPLPPEARRNYLYTYSGPQNAAPYEMFDDGKTLYFRYPDPREPLPSAAIIGRDGRESAVPVRRQGEYFAVDALAPEILLRLRGERVFVYNETLTTEPRP